MSWLIFVIISSVTFSVASILQRVLSVDKDSDPVAYSIVFQLITAFVIFIFALFYGFSLPNLIPLIPNLLLMTVFYAFFNVLLFKAYQKSEASEVSVIFATRTMWTVLTAVIFLHEGLSWVKLFGVIIVVLGVVIVSFRQTKWKLNQGHVLTLLAAFLFGSAFTNDAFLTTEFPNIPSYLALSFSLPAFFLMLIYPRSIVKTKVFLHKERLLKMLAMGVLWGAAAVTIFMAYEAGGTVTQIGPLGQISTILTVLLGITFLKERENWLQKLIGAIVIFSGVVLLL